MNRFNAGAVDLAHVRRIDQDECDERPEEGLLWDAVDLQRWDAEAEHIDDQDARHATEEVNVDRGEDAQRREGWRRDGARECNEEADRQDQQLGEDEELDIDEECPRNLRERSREVAAVKEGLLHLRPGGG